MKKNILILMLGLLITGIAFGQRHHKGKKANPELKKEMKAYIDKNVKPVLQKAQHEMDSKLSASDLEFIQAKRKEVSAVKEKRKAVHKDRMEDRKAMKEKWKNMTEEERKVFHEERKAEGKSKRGDFKKEHREDRAAVKDFMERNEAVIKTTMEQLKPQYEKWVTDQKAIIEKYKTDNAPAWREGKPRKLGLFGLDFHRGRGHKGKHGRRGGMHKGDKDNMDKRNHADRKHNRHAVAFVLWDSEMVADSRNEINENNISTSEISLGQNYPNPAKSTTQIKVDIPANIKTCNLIVTNLNGKVVKQINMTNLSAGTETIDLNVEDLPNGQYFYTIESNGFKISKKMTVNR